MAANKWKFTLEPGYFQDLAALAEASPNIKLTTQPSLALISRDYPSLNGENEASGDDQKPWVRFAAHVRALNRATPDNIRYKVMYLTRHGFGYHNKKHAEVGTEDWDVRFL